MLEQIKLFYVLQIQAFVRKTFTRYHYLLKRAACMHLQKIVRGYLCRLWQKRKKMYHHESLVKIQSLARMKIARSRYHSMIYSLLLLQTFIRTYVKFSAFRRIKFAALSLQRIYRGYCSRYVLLFVLIRIINDMTSGKFQLWSDEPQLNCRRSEE